ncbi:MAG: hypothetical protein NVSMB4_08180 [Acidimicrobiales bacterium]
MKLTGHERQQIVRFVRLFAGALLTQAIALQGTHLGRSVIIAAVLGSLEVAYRQFAPVVGTTRAVVKAERVALAEREKAAKAARRVHG